METTIVYWRFIGIMAKKWKLPQYSATKRAEILLSLDELNEAQKHIH